MSIFKKLDDLEKACCQITKEEVSGMIFLSDKMLQHILDATDDNHTKLEWISKIIGCEYNQMVKLKPVLL